LATWSNTLQETNIKWLKSHVGFNITNQTQRNKHVS